MDRRRAHLARRCLSTGPGPGAGTGTTTLLLPPHANLHTPVRGIRVDAGLSHLGNEPSTAHLYGPQAPDGIDSRQPFTVSTTFSETLEVDGSLGAAYDVTLTQGGGARSVHFFNPAAVAGSHSTSGRPMPVPSGDRVRMRQSLVKCAAADLIL